MKRETFIEAIEAIRRQMELDNLVSENLGKAFPNAHTANLIPDNHIVRNALTKVLQEQMNDNDGWIEWFCFEKDFGRNQLQANHADGSPIKLDSAGDLYDFLIQS